MSLVICNLKNIASKSLRRTLGNKYIIRKRLSDVRSIKFKDQKPEENWILSLSRAIFLRLKDESRWRDEIASGKLKNHAGNSRLP